MRAHIFSAATVIALGGCTTPHTPVGTANAFSEATPLCVVLENPVSYVGKRLLVRGYLTQTPEGREFWDDGCKRGFLPLKLLPEAGKARHLRSLFGTYTAHSGQRPPRVPVVYSGTLTDHSPALVCDGLCSQFSLEAAELVAVRAD
jgi:hypothetical protein